jgi:hypothetical protein
MTLYSFDFDNTLCMTPFPEDGKIVWEEVTGTVWPYDGWWGKADSLDLDVFNIPKNNHIYAEYLKAVSEADSYVILATGRLDKVPNMRKNIERILNKYNFSFDEVHLNSGGDTFNFKKNLFESLIYKTKCDRFVMYDDRIEHLVRFKDWSQQQECDIVVYDAINNEIL